MPPSDSGLQTHWPKAPGGGSFASASVQPVGNVEEVKTIITSSFDNPWVIDLTR